METVSRRLMMTFFDQDYKTRTISVSNPSDAVTDEVVQQVVGVIEEQQIFGQEETVLTIDKAYYKTTQKDQISFE